MLESILRPGTDSQAGAKAADRVRWPAAPPESARLERLDDGSIRWTGQHAFWPHSRRDGVGSRNYAGLNHQLQKTARPPEMSNVAPVEKVIRSDSRKSISSATSSVVPMRFMGMRETM